MIKDKITPQLKARFAREIQKTVGKGKEYGFLICKDEKGMLYPTKSTCEGEYCVNMESLISECSHKIEGTFHTHPHVRQFMQMFKKDGKPTSFKVARDIYLEATKKAGVHHGPSHGDLLGAIRSRYDKVDMGTTCVASDSIPNEVECWSIENDPTREIYDRAEKELDELDPTIANNKPRDWIKPLFKKEVIQL